MTRWARANNIHKARPTEPTPWAELRTPQPHQNRGNTAQQSRRDGGVDERGSRREGGVEERGSRREGGVEERGSRREGGVDERGSRREGGVEERGSRREGGVDERGSRREGGVEERGSRREGGVEERGKRREGGLEERGSKRKGGVDERGSRREGGVDERGSRREGGVEERGKRRKGEVDDVNGFMEYLKRTGQSLARGAAPPLDSGEEVLASFLRKDQRREKRRLKRLQAKGSSMVCFNCRKPGHGLADCPEADGDEELGRGICYRCGSTEHEIQRCRAKVDPALGDYPYAKCFICGQTGHLSRSCPDNPRGLYAAGGCCHVCGSVEHFQKDCPEHQNSGSSVTLRRLSNQISADQEDVHVSVKRAPPKKTKMVMF